MLFGAGGSISEPSESGCLCDTETEERGAKNNIGLSYKILTIKLKILSIIVQAVI